MSWSSPIHTSFLADLAKGPVFICCATSYRTELTCTSDGPALRALSLIAYANYLLDRGYLADIDYLRSHLYDSHQIRAPGKVIKNDLEEVAGSWWEAGFDLWEEV